MQMTFQGDDAKCLFETMRDHEFESLTELLTQFDWLDDEHMLTNIGLRQICEMIGAKDQNWSTATMLDIIKHHLADKAEKETEP